MSTITKQWLQQKIADMEAARDEIPFGLDEDDSNTLAALRIALASLEAEAVGYYRKGSDGFYFASPTEQRPGTIPLYAAPPVPFALPVQHWEELCRQNPDMSIGDAIIRAAWWNHCAAMLQAVNHTEQYLDMVDHSGDATEKVIMLQGAEPVTTGYKLPFEQWVSQRNEKIDVDCGCITTEAFFHWLRIAYEAGNSPVISDGWVPCSERMPDETQPVIVVAGGGVVQRTVYQFCEGVWCDWYEQNEDVNADAFTHWMPLPAAPLQEE